VPAGVAHDRLPRARAAVVVVAVGEALVRRRARVHGGGLHVYLGARRAVEVPDVDLTVVRAGVDVALVGGGGRREVAADQRFENAVTAEGDEGAVVGVGGMIEDVVGGEAVVEVRGVVLEGMIFSYVCVRLLAGWGCLKRTCGFILSPVSVETIFRKSQSLQV